MCQLSRNMIITSISQKVSIPLVVKMQIEKNPSSSITSKGKLALEKYKLK